VTFGYALVSWIKGEAGGQVLLQKQSGTWEILTHGGGWLGLGGLKQAGVTAGDRLNDPPPDRNPSGGNSNAVITAVSSAKGLFKEFKPLHQISPF